MRKLLLFALIILSIFLGYSFGFDRRPNAGDLPIIDNKKEILRVGLVADSHTENELLARALLQAKSEGASFVIGLGDYTNLGTIDELLQAKKAFDESGLAYFVIPGDRDGWESREKGEVNTANFSATFGKGSQVFEQNQIQFVLVDNSDIYSGILDQDWDLLRSNVQSKTSKLTFVFAHKTPFHPSSLHIMGEDSLQVAHQAREFVSLIENSQVDGFFSGDIHFFARFNSPNASVKITTIGAVASLRNFQGPRFAILKVFDDYSWEVDDVEIK